MKSDFSENLKELRLSRNLTQGELAKRLWVNKSIISAYENQERLPSVSVLVKISLEFNVSIEYLLGLDKFRTLDVSKLTDEQIVAIAKLIEQFEIANQSNCH